MSKKKQKRLSGGKKNRTKKNKSGNTALEKNILDYLTKKVKSGVKATQIYDYFERRYSSGKIESAIKRLTEKQKVEMSETGKLKLFRGERKQKEVTGVLDLARSGVGYVRIDGVANDVFIPKKAVGFALSNDTVKIRITKRGSSGKTEGVITEIVKRNQEEFICYFQPADGFGFAVPTNGRVPFDFFIPESYTKDCGQGDLALVQVINWDDGQGKNPVGRVVEKLSGLPDNELEMKSILLEQGFNLVFPSKVMREASAINANIPNEVIKERFDYRSVVTMTIDPDDAKDFDDALSYKQLKNGDIQIGVHIADVSHYVTPNSPMDIEAQYRATSVYLPDRVCPMLPEKISNVVCSLRPDEEKCAFSVLFDINEKLEIVNYTFAKTVIKSNHRFTYNEAQAVIEGRSKKYKKELLFMKAVAEKLRKKRTEHGAINFDTEEVRFKLDENAVPIDLYVKERKDAHLLVEDFMLLANTTVAKYLSSVSLRNKSIKAVYRVHDKPDSTKLDQLKGIAARFGYKFSFNDEAQVRSALNNLMDVIKGKPEMEILSRLAIRTMAKAEYTTTNIGHYGLAFEHYTHFTSPIRRYPDVLVHRLLEERLAKERATYTPAELEEMCKQSSLMERKAQKAEREAIKYKQVEFLQSKIGTSYEGVISGVMAKGFFVELIENKCEGFVNVQDLDENYLYDESKMRLTGMHSKTMYQIGQKVQVVLLKADLKEKRIELDILE